MALDLGELVGRVRLDTTQYDRQYGQIESALRQLARLSPEVTVSADVSTAVGNLAEVEATAQSLPDGTLTVTADTSAATGALEDLGQDAEAGLSDAGSDAGDGMGKGIMTALIALPIVGTVLGIGAAAGKALLDGLQNEVREDRLMATTGLDAATAKRFGMAAGEAYAANFGESIAANMDTARIALQSGLLDPDATARDSQKVIEQLSGVADILGEDIPRVAQATAVILRTGLAKDAAGAFDIMVKGAQKGANSAEDLLDTFIEYPALFQRLGLDAGDSLGLISQGLQAGARNSDLVADALKEFQIRATDASETSAAAFEAVGLNAEDMTAKIAAGGAGAREGLDEVLDGLRAIEDPVARNAAAVGLFGTQAEDLGAALFAMDLDTVAADLGNLAGVAEGAIATLGDNTAGQIESAQRNIEVAADGIKGALAAAFGDEIEGAATFIQENRAAVVQFLLDMSNGAIDFGRVLVESLAAGIETFGELSGAMGDVALQLFDMFNALNQFGPFKGQLDGAVEGLGRAALAAGDIEEAASTSAEALRTRLIEQGLDPAQAKLNDLGIPLVTQAAFHDATTALANDVAAVGYGADGAALQVTNLSGSFDKTTEAGKLLDGQLRTAVASMDANVAAGALAGQSVEELTADYDRNRESLVAQVEAMGFSREEAGRLVDAYGAVPAVKNTKFNADTAAAVAAVADLQERIDNIRDGNAKITITQATSYVRQEDAMASRAPGRASGGSVWPGQPFWVGEEGPELVTFGQSGYVHDAATSAAAVSTPQSSVKAISRADMDYLADRVAEGVAARPTNIDGHRVSGPISRSMTMGVRS